MHDISKIDYAFYETKIAATFYILSAVFVSILPRSVFKASFGDGLVRAVGEYWPAFKMDYETLMAVDEGLAGKYAIWVLAMPIAFLVFTLKYQISISRSARASVDHHNSLPRRDHWMIIGPLAVIVLFIILFAVPVEFKARSLSEFVLINSAALWWLEQLFVFGMLWRINSMKQT